MVLEAMKYIILFMGCFLLQRCVIPLKKGIINENQAQVSRGVAYLLSGLYLVYAFVKTRGI